ncbi:MAG: hypothetical protein AB7T49_03915 [Oligoflexales bacterium]
MHTLIVIILLAAAGLGFLGGCSNASNESTSKDIVTNVTNNADQEAYFYKVEENTLTRTTCQEGFSTSSFCQEGKQSVNYTKFKIIFSERTQSLSSSKRTEFLGLLQSPVAFRAMQDDTLLADFRPFLPKLHESFVAVQSSPQNAPQDFDARLNVLIYAEDIVGKLLSLGLDGYKLIQITPSVTSSSTYTAISIRDKANPIPYAYKTIDLGPDLSNVSQIASKLTSLGTNGFELNLVTRSSNPLSLTYVAIAAKSQSSQARHEYKVLHVANVSDAVPTLNQWKASGYKLVQVVSNPRSSTYTVIAGKTTGPNAQTSYVTLPLGEDARSIINSLGEWGQKGYKLVQITRSDSARMSFMAIGIKETNSTVKYNYQYKVVSPGGEIAPVVTNWTISGYRFLQVTETDQFSSNYLAIAVKEVR